MEEEKDVSEEVPMNEQELQEQKEKEEKEKAEKEDKKDDEKSEESELPKKTTKTVSKKVMSWVQQNKDKALWLKEISKIEPEEYKTFYKNFTGDYSEPLDWIHFKVEGDVEFTALLFIPKVMPFAHMLRSQEDKKKKASLKLFVRRVLISDDFTELLPPYFSFIKGIVDSDDLPLNVSRETLQ